MEHLTKHQIILLALLVSFVSSIATGIVTVSLLDQAPPAVTQTINRVVEHTIEKVGAATSTKETFVVKEDQAVIDAIAKASRSIVTITSQSDGFVGLGVIVSDSGMIAAHSSVEPAGNLSAKLSGGNVVPARFISRDPSTGVALFQAEQSSDPRYARAYTAAALASLSDLKLGQSIVLIGGEDDPVVATGIVSSIHADRVRTDVRDSAFDSQAILVNLLGEVVGIKDQTGDNAFLASQSINKS